MKNKIIYLFIYFRVIKEKISVSEDENNTNLLLHIFSSMKT